MNGLHALAAEVGLAPRWRDVEGAERVVTDPALVTILGALGYPADDEAQVRASRARREEEQRRPPAFLSADQGKSTALPPSLAHAETAELVLEDGSTRPLALTGGVLPPVDAAGYHRLHLLGHEIVFAVAPSRCLSTADLLSRAGRQAAPLWGPAIQIPSLRGDESRSFGDLGDLRDAVSQFAARGAQAVAISPVHALFPGRGEQFSPYSPSSRIALNTALADPALAGLDGLNGLEGSAGPAPAALIDWATAIPKRLAALRVLFARLRPEQRRAIGAWGESEGADLRRHALFDALSLHFRDRGPGWQSWPADFHDVTGPAVARFAAEHSAEVDFHLFAQWLAERSLASVQDAATGAGMAIGLISDLAVGIDPGGSDAWALRDRMLTGLTIGAPPDPLGPDGQNWGLTSFSPHGLAASGFAPWLATLRAALRHAGGVRIDHAFGLARLWVVPQGGQATDGAYLTYPLADFLRLVALESHRAGAIVVGEDLGTRPPGFLEEIGDKGILGMRVLWFERDGAGNFIHPHDYDAAALAMTGTHDTATVAGWWRCRDIEWNRRLGRGADWQAQAGQRVADRAKLWQAIGDASPAPAPEDPAPVVDAAIAHVGKARCELAIVPLEDLLALDEQPNLPGTIDEHPNWRRRLPGPLSQLLADPGTARRIAALCQARAGLQADSEAQTR